jgi:hypothetical protein
VKIGFIVPIYYLEELLQGTVLLVTLGTLIPVAIENKAPTPK